MNLEYLCVSFSDLSERFFVNLGKLFCGKLLCRFYSLLFLFGIFNVYACYCRIALLNTDIFLLPLRRIRLCQDISSLLLPLFIG